MSTTTYSNFNVHSTGTDSIDLWMNNLQQGIVQQQDIKQFNDGEVVIRQGDPWKGNGDHMYFVLQGQFRVAISGIPVRTLSDGEHFGEVSMFLKKARTATVRCVTKENLVMMLPYDKFQVVC